MSRIELETFVAAPPERCFDLSLSVEIHLESTARTGERAVGGKTSGILGAGDTVTWRAKHLGLWHQMTVRIPTVDRPRMFRDEMVSGPFRRMGHDHWFDARDGGTLMRDVFEFSSGFAPLDALVIAPHLRRFLLERNEMIRSVAESDDWHRYLEPAVKTPPDP